MLLKRLSWKIAQFLELVWWKQYLKNKAFPTYLLWKQAYWIDFLKKLNLTSIITPSESIKIADLGSGPAGIFTVLANATCTAVDPLMNEYIVKGWITRNQYPKTQFVNQKLEEVKIEKQDVVFCLNCINHVDDINVSLRTIAELTHEESIIVISTDVHRFAFLKFIIRCFPFLDPLHPYQLDNEDYIRLFEQQGLKVQESLTIEKHSIFDYRVYKIKKS